LSITVEPITDATPARSVDLTGRHIVRTRQLVTLPMVVAVVSALVALCGSLWLFPLLTENNDEGPYLSQAAALQAGHLTPVAPAFADSFQPWMSVQRNGHYVYKYAPVHASLLALSDRVFGAERVALGLTAGASVLLLFGVCSELGLTRRASLTAPVLLALSPVFVIQSMTFLSYVTSLALSLGFMYLLLRGIRRSSAPNIVGSGALLGLAFFARPFDAVLFATPVLAWVMLRSVRQGTSARPTRILWLLSAGAAPGIVCFLGYNWIAAGGPFHLPFLLQDKTDTLGFGYHGLWPATNYTVALATKALFRNMLLVVLWVFGGGVVALLAVYGVTQRHLTARWLLIGMLATWPAGMFFFWGSYLYTFTWDGGRFLGPYYYLPVLVPLVIAGGVGVDRLLSYSKTLSVVAVAAALALTVPIFDRAIDSNRARTAKREAVNHALHTAVRSQSALVFLPPVWGSVLQNPFSFLRNNADYNGRLVYAVKRGAVDFAVARAYADRHVFIMSLPDGYQPGPHGTTRVRVERAALRTGRALDIGVQVPKSLPINGLSLQVGFDDDGLDIPFSIRGRASVRLESEPGAVILTDTSTGAQARLAIPSDLSLHLALVQAMPDGAPLTVMSRRVDMKVHKRRLAVLWPGELTSMALPDNLTTWSARTATP